MNIIILTNSFLRHRAFAKRIYMSSNIKISAIYYEEDHPLQEKILKNQLNKLELDHFKERSNAEEDIFKWFLDLPFDEDKKNLIEKNVYRGWISTKEALETFIKINPDLIVVYGTSIIKGEFINYFRNKIINIHLGLSPYYRGSGTNYFPFVNNEPEYCGATFMYLDEGIDTGKIIHQIRPDIFENDSFHQLSNRFLKKVFDECVKLIFNYDRLKEFPIDSSMNFNIQRYYKNKDFTIESLNLLKNNFKEGILSNYLADKKNRDLLVPIISQNFL